MSFTNEGRLSDSAYIESVWRGQAGVDCFPNCPAEGRWHMLLLRENGKIKMSVAGPMTHATTEHHHEGVEWLVVKFKLGTYIPYLPAPRLVDSRVVLPDGARNSFWLNGDTWQTPDFENAETFVDWLAHDEVLVHDPIVHAALQDQPMDMPARTLRHRFQRVTGLTQSTIRQIERAQLAVTLLENGMSILDAVVEAGYADQPHMTRSLKYFMGQTPAQITPIRAIA